MLKRGRDGERAEIRRTAYPLEETLAAMERKGMRPEKIEAMRHSVRKWPVD